MKPNMSVGLRCRLTQPTGNGQGIVYFVAYSYLSFCKSLYPTRVYTQNGWNLEFCKITKNLDL
jgi:hypothetical protein